MVTPYEWPTHIPIAKSIADSKSRIAIFTVQDDWDDILVPRQLEANKEAGANNKSASAKTDSDISNSKKRQETTVNAFNLGRVKGLDIVVEIRMIHNSHVYSLPKARSTATG
jgi:hypothetical protein